MNSGQKMMAFGVLGILLIVGFVIYSGDDQTVSSGNIDANKNDGASDNDAGLNKEDLTNTDQSLSIWQTVELTDVKTGDTFKISDFSETPVLIESFAVWCPTCKKQQDEIKKLVEDGDTSIHISIDIDPKEDESKVLDHITRNEYDWNYVIFPVEGTQSLVDDFGPGIVSAPSVPMILICPGEEPRKLGSGIKDVEELKEEIGKC